MSTYWYFECVSHDPPLRSGGEFTQHTDDSAFRTALTLAAARPLPEEGVWPEVGFFERQARSFLQQHPACRLGIVSEYGERREVVGADCSTPSVPATDGVYVTDQFRNPEIYCG